MMMKMLEAGGCTILADHVRSADIDNPKGYYEFERAKQLENGDTGWLVDAEHKTVKIISALLKYLPLDYKYKIIFMTRNLDEVIASQRKMLVNREEDSNTVTEDKLQEMLEIHLLQTRQWLSQQPNILVHYVSYNTLLTDEATQISEITNFIGGELEPAQMLKIIEPTLHRNKS